MSIRTIIMAIITVMLLTVPFCCDQSEASSVTVEDKRVLITNIYGSQFISPGTLDEGEHENSGLYYFIEGSDRHIMFLKYLDGNLNFIPNDDWMVINEGSNVHAYFFDSNTYQEWHTLVTFEAPDGDIKFKSISFEIERPIHELNHFFLGGSVAHIEWANNSPIAVSAFFNGAELKDKSVDIDIENNGACSLKFVIVSDMDGVVSTTISYTIDGYDDSDSMPLGIVCWIVFLIILFGVLLLRGGPKWSGKGGME